MANAQLGWLNKLWFGKYKDKTIRWVWGHDVTYLEWCLDNVDGFNLEHEVEQLVWLAAAEIDHGR